MNPGRHQRGFSLLEVSIGSALGFVVLAVAVQLLLSVQQNLRLANAYARLNENARAAMTLMRSHIRAAGSLPCIPSALDSLLSESDATELLAISAPGEVTPIRGDVLSVQSFRSLPAETLPASGAIVVAATAGGDDCVIFEAPAAAEAHPVLAASPRLSIAEQTRYYLDQSVGQSGLSSLFRARQSRGGQREELVEGVYDLRIAYGVDQTGNGAMNAFLPAEQVSDWAAVQAVRLWLLVGSGGPVVGSGTLPHNLVWPDGEPVQFETTQSSANQNLYRVFSTTVAIERQM